MKILLCFICSILLLSSSIAAQQEKKQPIRSTYHMQKKGLFELLPDTADEIIFLGNSITDGGEWSELFSSLRIKNRGISADKSDGVLERLHEITASRPAQIFIMIGVNDLAAGLNPNQVLENYRKIIKRIMKDSDKTEIFIQSVLPVNDAFPRFKNHVSKSEMINTLNHQLRLLAKEHQLLYIDLHSHFSTAEGKLNEKYTNDGLHLTGAGYLLWKSLLAKYIDL